MRNGTMKATVLTGVLTIVMLAVAQAGYCQTTTTTVNNEQNKDVIPVSSPAYLPSVMATNEPVSMPAISAPSTTSSNGIITVTLATPVLPSQLSGLWAKVKYDTKTEYWKLDPAMLSADGKIFTMQFDPRFDGKDFQLQLYGFDAGTGEQTNFSNAVVFKITVPSSVTMPSITAPATTDSTGTIKVTFNTAMLPSTLNGLWAKVTYDGKTEYWKLDPGMISEDGKTFTMQFSPQFYGKNMSMQLYGYAASDSSQTNYSNTVTFQISATSALTMPSISAPSTTDASLTIRATFSQALDPDSLDELWAKVTYDGKTEYWKLDPGMISADGKTFTMNFEKAFKGKEMTMQLYGVAASNGTQTNLSNAITFSIESATDVIMPVLPSTGETDPQGNITVTFASGTLLPAQLTQLWAEATYDGKTEYWELSPALLSADGKSFFMNFNSSLDGKQVTFSLYGFDTYGIQTGMTNPIVITVHSSPEGAAMPAISAPTQTENSGAITVSFTDGTLMANQLTELWAQVTYDGKTEYWKLDPSIIAADGKSLSLQFQKDFNGKTLTMQFFGYDTDNVRTDDSNAVTFKVVIPDTGVTIPAITAPAVTDNDGSIVFSFGQQVLQASQLSELWAQVVYDGKTEYWKLDPDMISLDGKSMSMKFDQKFDGKTLAIQFFGYDQSGIKTNTTNQVTFTINVAAGISMPVMTAPSTTDDTGTIVVSFSQGTLYPNQLTEFWAQVTYDNKTEYWKLDPAMISQNGTSLTMSFPKEFNGKTVTASFYGFDTQGVQTAFSNPVTFTVQIPQTTLVMPTLPSYASTDTNQAVTVNFSSGTLLASQLQDLWAEVIVDNQTYYWDLTPEMLAADGKSLYMEFPVAYKGKSVRMRFFGFDLNGLQTAFTNAIIVEVN